MLGIYLVLLLVLNRTPLHRNASNHRHASQAHGQVPRLHQALVEDPQSFSQFILPHKRSQFRQAHVVHGIGAQSGHQHRQVLTEPVQKDCLCDCKEDGRPEVLGKVDDRDACRCVFHGEHCLHRALWSVESDAPGKPHGQTIAGNLFQGRACRKRGH